jgi:hypothetical protein
MTMPDGARIVDEDVYAAELSDRLVDERCNILEIANVTGKGESATPGFLDLSRPC